MPPSTSQGSTAPSTQPPTPGPLTSGSPGSEAASTAVQRSESTVRAGARDIFVTELVAEGGPTRELPMVLLHGGGPGASGMSNYARNPPAQRELAAAATIELLTVNQVAAMLRVSKMTVYRMIHAGTLRAVRIEGSLQLHRDSVETFVHIAMRMRSGN